jgi:predicted RecA/RadA family phage recombinase
MAEAIIRGDVRTISLTAAGTLTAKTVREMVDCIGVYMANAVAGQRVAVAIAEGPVELDKETGVVFAVGDKLYWDATNDRLDKTATNIPAGVAANAADTNATRAEVWLVPGIGTA